VVCIAGAYNPFDDRPKLAVEHRAKLAAPGAAREHDALDEATKGFDCLWAIIEMVESVGQQP